MACCLQISHHNTVCTQFSCSARLILLGFSAVVAFGEQYTCATLPLSCYFLLGPNVFLSTLPSNTCTLCNSLTLDTKFHTRIKQQAK